MRRSVIEERNWVTTEAKEVVRAGCLGKKSRRYLGDCCCRDKDANEVERVNTAD